MMRSRIYLICVGVAALWLCGFLVYGQWSAGSAGVIGLTGKRHLVQVLGLTDLSLFSEARYTRHPSQADLFAAFQDFPAAFEHFPTGSIIQPDPAGFSSRIYIDPRTDTGK